MIGFLRRSCGIASMAIVIGPCTLAAQQDEPATIPTALASALLGPYLVSFGGRVHYVVARSPDGWPSALNPPRPAETVGGTTIGPFRATVYRYPRSADAMREYRRLLASAGYAPGGSPRAKGGFTSGTRFEPFSYCGHSNDVSLAEGDSTSTTRSIVVVLVPTAMLSGCGGSASDQEVARQAYLELPSMTAPPGATAQPSGTGTSTSQGTARIETSVLVSTSMSADSVLAHYAGQLRAAGWQVGERLAGNGMAMQLLSVHDKGNDWSGSLVVITVGDRHDVSLRMFRAAGE